MMKAVVFLLVVCLAGAQASSSRARLLALKSQVASCAGGFLCGIQSTSTSCTVECVPVANVCDGTPQCSNGQDEVGCPVVPPDPLCVCGDGEYQCAGTDTCIPVDMICNGEQNCPDNDDEATCTMCDVGTYRCAVGDVCVARTQICDGTADCPVAGDDEFAGCRCNLLGADDFSSCAATWNIADNSSPAIIINVEADFATCRSLCCAHADCDAFVVDDPNCYLLNTATPGLATTFDDTAVTCTDVAFYVVDTS